MSSKAEKKQARQEIIKRELDRRAEAETISEHGAVAKEECRLSLGAISIFFLIGCGVYFLISAYVLQLFPSIPQEDMIELEIFAKMAAAGIGVFPIWWSLICGGWMGLLQVSSSIIVTTTTYSDGTVEKSSNADMVEGFNGLMAVFWFVAGYFVAVIATMIYFAAQFVLFIIKFPRVKNKILYAVQLAVIVAFFALAPSYVAKLQPKFDPNHFKPDEIARVAETAQKELYSGNFSFSMEKRGKKIKGPYTAIVSYNKAKDETVVEVLAGRQDFASWRSEEEIKSLKKEAAKKFIKEFDKGKVAVLPGKYTFKDNELVKSEVDAEIFGNRAMGEAGIAEIAGLLPSNFFFKRILDDKNRLRYLPMEDVVAKRHWKEYENRVFIRTPLGAYSGASKKAFSLDFIKSGDDYKLLREKDGDNLIEPYWVRYNEPKKK
jgi:hypothetical protein